METLTAICIVLAIVTVVGHGIWVLLAAFFRILSGSTTTDVVQLDAHCPHCAKRVVPGAKHCRFCGRQLVSHPCTLESELTVVERQLNRLIAEGRLESEDSDRVLDVIRQQRQTLSDSPDRLHDSTLAQAEGRPRRVQPEKSSEVAASQQFFDQTKASETADEPAPEPPAVLEIVEILDDETEEELVEVETYEELAAATSVVEPPAADQPRLTFGDLALRFMEQRNIRWGELVSGLLIVGSAAGLVISLWSTLDRIPYFPALLFLLVTLALHGAGRYTLSRWRLRSTSQGLLLISTFLVPLNFVAGVAVSRSEISILHPLYLVALLLSLAALGGVVFSAGRRLMLRQPGLIVLGGFVAPLSQVAASRLLNNTSSQAWVMAIAALALAPAVAAIVIQGWLTAGWNRLTERRIAQVLLVLATSTFAVGVSLAVVTWKTGNVAGSLSQISPLLSLLPIVAAGTALAIRRGLRDGLWSGWRVVIESIVILCAMGMLADVLIAWPHPGRLLAMSVVGFLAMTAMASRFRADFLHLPAGCSLACGLVLGGLHLDGTLTSQAVTSRTLVAALLSGSASGYFWLSALVMAAVGWWPVGSSALERRFVRSAYRGLTVGLTLVAALIAVRVAYVDGPGQLVAAAVWLVTSIEALILGDIRRKRLVTYAAVISCWLATLNLVTGVEPIVAWLQQVIWIDRDVSLLTSLAFATLAGGLSWVLNPRAGDADRNRFLTKPLAHVALAISGLTLPGVLGEPGVEAWQIARDLFWLSGIWLSTVEATRSRAVLWMAQAISAAAALQSAVAWSVTATWWPQSVLAAWQLPEFLHRVIWSWLGCGVLWHTVRRVLVRRGNVWDESPLVFERLLLAGVTVGVCILSAVCVYPAFISELPGFAVLPTASLATWAVLTLWLLSVGLTVWFLTRGVCSPQQLVVWLPLPVLASIGCTALGTAAGEVHPGFSDFAAAWSQALPTWAIIGTLTLVWAEFWRTARDVASVALLACPLIVLPLLVATAGAGTVGAASVLRWEAALCAVVTAGFIAASESRRGRQLIQRLGAGRIGAEQVSVNGFRLIWLAATLLLAINVRFVALLIFQRELPVSLLPGGLGAALVSYLVPLGIGWTAILLSSWSRRSETQTAAAVWWGTLGTGLACILWWGAQQPIPRFSLDDLVQFIAQLSATAAVLWWLRSNIGRSTSVVTVQRLSGYEAWIGAHAATVLLAGFMSVTVMNLILLPLADIASVSAAGHWSLLAAIAVVMTTRIPWRQPLTTIGTWHSFEVLGLSLVVWLACALAEQRTSAEQAGADAMLAIGTGLVLLANVVALLIHRYQNVVAASEQPRTDVGGSSLIQEMLFGWSHGLCVAVAMLSVRVMSSSPQAETWFVVSLAMLWGALALLALATSRQIYVLATFAVVLSGVWMRLVWNGSRQTLSSGDWWHACLLQTLLITACNVLIWQVLELWMRRKRREAGRLWTDLNGSVSGNFGHAAIVATLVFAVAALEGGLGATRSRPQAIEWWTVATLLSAMVIALRNGFVPSIGLAVYGLWMTCEVLGLRLVDWPVERRHVVISVALACNLILCGLAVQLREVWGAWIGRLGCRWPADDRRSELVTLQAFNSMIAAGIGLFGLVTVLRDHSLLHRLSAAGATLLLLPGLSWQSSVRREWWRLAGLLAGVTGGVQFTWALMPVDIPAHEPLLRVVRSFITLSVGAGVLAACSHWIRSAWGSWREPLHRAAAVVVVTATVNLLVILAGELNAFRPGVGLPLHKLDIAAVGAALVGVVVILITLALNPQRDPFRLTELGRTAYVYAAEAVLALLFLHLYLAVPELFTGRFRRYWPFFVMAVAYLGVGIGELLHRRQLRVLSRPLQRTGVFLPLLPALALWSGEPTGVSLYLFLLGLLYVLLSVWKQSFGFALAAGIAGNAALWSLYHEQGVEIVRHPQMFLIPPALSLLVAAQLNRTRLAEGQLASIRYGCMLVIYLSSTSEMFIRGIAETIWLPMVLALLSVIGVFTGILLRVRSFLYISITFLVLSIVSMVWHATRALDHSWPWWVFGISLGCLILTVFGLFEKRRNEMQRVIDQLRSWER